MSDLDEQDRIEAIGVVLWRREEHCEHESQQLLLLLLASRKREKATNHMFEIKIQLCHSRACLILMFNVILRKMA